MSKNGATLTGVVFLDVVGLKASAWFLFSGPVRG